MCTHKYIVAAESPNYHHSSREKRKSAPLHAQRERSQGSTLQSKKKLAKLEAEKHFFGPKGGNTKPP